eukprot:gene137-186_t
MIDLLDDCFTDHLLAWYQQHKRTLPWRETTDPYKIWLSEIILQQTRVVQGMPYYQRFIENYPTLIDLVAAGEEAVLRIWQGLGYYTRARNLYACAAKVLEEFQGNFPSNYQTLLTLPGIGPYTAAAIASIAFHEAVPAIDGNVYRVLARIFGITMPINSVKSQPAFRQLAEKLISKNHPGTYNQAMMEFGALQCTPTNPLCGTCIFRIHCVAFNTQRQDQLPIKIPKGTVKKRFFHYLCIQQSDQVLMKRRKMGDIWTGLYDFYLIEDAAQKEFAQLEDGMVSLIAQHQLHVNKIPPIYKHVLTHRVIYASFFQVNATAAFMDDVRSLLGDHMLDRLSLEDTKRLPKPQLICNFLEEYLY